MWNSSALPSCWNREFLLAIYEVIKRVSMSLEAEEGTKCPYRQKLQEQQNSGETTSKVCVFFSPYEGRILNPECVCLTRSMDKMLLG